MQSRPFFIKAYLLAALAIVLTLLSTRYAFWNTWEAWRLNEHLSKSIDGASDVSVQPDYLERKDKNLNKAIQFYKVDTLSHRSNVLTAISSLAEQEKVRIIDVPTEGNNLYFQTRLYKIDMIELRGEFANLMRFYNKMLAVNGIGVLRSVSFLQDQQQQEHMSKEGKLRLLLYLEILR